MRISRYLECVAGKVSPLHTRSDDARRVVVTGIGILTSLGIGKETVLKRLFRGETSIQSLDGHEYSKLPCRLAALVPTGTEQGALNLESRFSTSERKKISKATALALIAAEEALTDANWTASLMEDKERTGVAVGMGMVPLDDVVSTGVALQTEGYNRVSPFFIPRILTNMAAGQISIKHGFLGPNHAVSTACTTGLHAVGDAFRLVRSGDADVMVCGGTEASVNALAIAAFARMRALCTKFNNNPSAASRPFDVDRDGFVMGEGAAILVLEEFSHALNRGAKMYAEILGYGMSGDGHHLTAPREDGLGAYLCMKAALRDACVHPHEVGYINAHATSTPIGDIAEARAIKRVFGHHSEHILVSSTKGAIGHLLGAAGSAEAVFTVEACFQGIVPPTANLEKPEEGLNLDFCPVESKPFPTVGKRRISLTNSFGFGGTNASVCISSIV